MEHWGYDTTSVKNAPINAQKVLQHFLFKNEKYSTYESLHNAQVGK